MLGMVEFAYNNSRNASTGTSPFRLFYGFDPNLPITVAVRALENEYPTLIARGDVILKAR